MLFRSAQGLMLLTPIEGREQLREEEQDLPLPTTTDRRRCPHLFVGEKAFPGTEKMMSLACSLACVYR